jgi:hypothetical protein
MIAALSYNCTGMALHGNDLAGGRRGHVRFNCHLPCALGIGHVDDEADTGGNLLREETLRDPRANTRLPTKWARHV